MVRSYQDQVRQTAHVDLRDIHQSDAVPRRPCDPKKDETDAEQRNQAEYGQTDHQAVPNERTAAQIGRKNLSLSGFDGNEQVGFLTAL